MFFVLLSLVFSLSFPDDVWLWLAPKLSKNPHTHTQTKKFRMLVASVIDATKTRKNCHTQKINISGNIIALFSSSSTADVVTIVLATNVCMWIHGGKSERKNESESSKKRKWEKEREIIRIKRKKKREMNEREWEKRERESACKLFYLLAFGSSV